MKRTSRASSKPESLSATATTRATQALSPAVLQMDPLDVLRLRAELKCHVDLQCVDCHLAEVGWHEVVCLTPCELSLLQRILDRLYETSE